MVRFPAAAVDALRDLATTLNDVTELLVSPLGKLAGSQVALMTGPAGVGKTYLAIDAVARRLAKGRPSVMMHGRWFNSNDPLTHLRDVLKMPSDLDQRRDHRAPRRQRPRRRRPDASRH